MRYFLGKQRLVAIAIFIGCGTVMHAAEPAIRSLDIRGLRVGGGATTLTIDGDDLGLTPRLLLPFAAKQTLKPGGTDKKAVFDVTLAADVVPGYHHLRVVSESGVSLPVVIGVDALPQQPLTPTLTQLPIALHGTVAGSATVETKFPGKAKQRVIVEVESQRLGGKLRPIIHLYSPKKLQVAWAWGVPTLFGDTRLETVLPQDGTYTVALHDVEYAAGAPGFFRLKIGDWSFVDQVFPPFVSANKSQGVELLGMATAARMDVTTAKSADVLPLSWPKGGLWSGPRPFVRVSSRAEFVEQPVAEKKLQELPEGPLAVSGRLLSPDEEDRYRLAVSPGKKVRLEVFAERIGSPMDVALVVRNEQGVQLARAEDSPGTLDPILEYTVPDKVTAIVVGVLDAAGRGGPRGVYRLTVDPQTTATKGDAFKLTTVAQRAVLSAGGRTILPVLVERRGYAGKIDLTSKLPKGIKANGTTIPEGADGTLITLERNDTAFDADISHWRGRGDDGLEVPVILKGHPLERLQPWLATEFAIAPTNVKTADFAINWRELPATVGLIPGVKLNLPIKAPRTIPKTTVKLTLLTSQNTPLLNNVPDPAKALRQEKAVELAAAAIDGEIVILVPANLSAPTYDVTVQAELLDPAKKVLATAYTPVRRMSVNLPFVVKLDGSSRVEAMLDAKKGAVVKFAGTIERREGVKADIALTLTGLPAGAKAEAVTVKADASVFAVTVTLPPTVAAGEFKGIKLTGSFAPEPKTPAVRVSSREVDVTLVIQAAKK